MNLSRSPKPESSQEAGQVLNPRLSLAVLSLGMLISAFILVPRSPATRSESGVSPAVHSSPAAAASQPAAPTGCPYFSGSKAGASTASALRRALTACPSGVTSSTGGKRSGASVCPTGPATDQGRCPYSGMSGPLPNASQPGAEAGRSSDALSAPSLSCPIQSRRP